MYNFCITSLWNMTKCAYTIARETSARKTDIISILLKLQGQDLPEEVRNLMQKMFVTPAVNDVSYYEDLVDELKEILEENEE